MAHTIKAPAAGTVTYYVLEWSRPTATDRTRSDAWISDPTRYATVEDAMAEIEAERALLYGCISDGSDGHTVYRIVERTEHVISSGHGKVAGAIRASIADHTARCDTVRRMFSEAMSDVSRIAGGTHYGLVIITAEDVKRISDTLDIKASDVPLGAFVTQQNLAYRVASIGIREYATAEFAKAAFVELTGMPLSTLCP